LITIPIAIVATIYAQKSKRCMIGLQYFVVIMVLINLLKTLKDNQDVINTRTPNVEKTLPYYHAVLHVFVVFMFMKFITISKLKFFLLFSYYLLVILLLDDYDHEKYWWFLFILTAILLLILHLHKKDNDILQ